MSVAHIPDPEQWKRECEAAWTAGYQAQLATETPLGKSQCPYGTPIHKDTWCGGAIRASMDRRAARE